MVARWAHNPKVVGSSPTPATRRSPVYESAPGFLFPKRQKLAFVWAAIKKNVVSTASKAFISEAPLWDSRSRRLSNTTPATKEDSSSDLMGSFLFVPSEIGTLREIKNSLWRLDMTFL